MAQSSDKKTTQTKKSTASKSTTTRKRSTPAKQAPIEKPKKKLGRGIWSIILLILGGFSLLGLLNTEGWLIKYAFGFVKGMLGYGYYLLPICLFAAALILGFHKGRPVRLRVTLILIQPLLIGALLQIVLSKVAPKEGETFMMYLADMYEGGIEMKSGGVVAGFLGEGIKSALSIYGAVPILIAGILASLGLAYNTAVYKLVAALKNYESVRAERIKARIEAPVFPEEEIFPEFEEEDDSVAYVPNIPQAIEEPKPKKRRRQAIDIPFDGDGSADNEATFHVTEYGEVIEHDVQNEISHNVEQFFQHEQENAGFANNNEVEPMPEIENIPTAEVAPLNIEEAEAIAGVPRFEQKPIATASIRSDKKKNAELVLEEAETISKIIEEQNAEEHEEYRYPPVSLLRSSPSSVVDGREEMETNKGRLQVTLKSFGVNATVKTITRGPTVTRYDLELDAGVKLAKITNLAGDIALSLGVTGVRIAPIPDKISTVGIEVPNKLISAVYLRDIIDSNNFKSSPSKLSFSIGKDIGGNAIIGNIAKLPHLLIAGTTGSGKSVCMNSLIISLLYKSSPEEVKLIMIDPKMVELGIYNGIPHLYVPVVTDPKKAAGALQWSVVEMLKRYRLFSEVGVRDLASYNAYQQKIGGQTLPQVVIVIDELADLMLVAAKEVEESICRVAQMGRASGMHLVIATQRPSADVITGLMKANIPSRIAFAVSSGMESRIILDTLGAEKLIGMGDMLYAPLGSGKPMRVQGAFISDEEREEIINYIKEGTEAQYSEEILGEIERAAEEKPSKGDSKQSSQGSVGDDYDEMLPQAVEVIFETKQASVSLLQRRLKLGYARAARIVDQMEEIGILGPFEGSKPRQILMTADEWFARNNTPTQSEISEQMEIHSTEYDTAEDM